ncbi:MAG: fumarylacetoacetate hydrolase family protein [Candidatus Hodarchaeales archaeon]|jgi:2-keto-4-pentenoate hydratase/2-oxohepta-3-ene-1,7-dioic acid hydratase in catechol pathway
MAAEDKNKDFFLSMEELLSVEGFSFEMTKNVVKESSPINVQEPVQLLAPLMRPSKIICLGKNYLGHVKETKASVPANPILFPKFSTSIIGYEEAIILPEFSQAVDYEIELAVIIGKKARKIPPEEVFSYIAGYTIANDVTARDIQRGDGQWTRGKSLDTFLPLGPFLVTADEIIDPQNLKMRLQLNSEVMQEGSTADMIFPIPEIISFISEGITLLPGDIILTGTPPGVGFARDPPVFLKSGDRLELEIEGLGRLCNPVIRQN